MSKVIAILGLLVVYTSCLNFRVIGSKQFCMRFEGGNKHTLEYVISGN